MRLASLALRTLRLAAAAALALPLFAQADTNIRVMAANISSGNNQSYDGGHGTRIFQGLDPDVVLIQEFNYGNNSASVLQNWVNTTFGSQYLYFRETGAQIPNGIITRWPILESGQWNDSQVSNRDFAWARIDIPGPVDLWAVSVHFLTSNASDRNAEAQQLRSYIQGKVPADAYLVIGGDLNTGSRSESALTTLSSLVKTSGPYPVDQNNNGNTNAGRAKPYDWVLADSDLGAYEIPVAVGGSSFAKGLVFDSRVFSPLSAVSPVQSGDSGATNMQHMAVIRDFRVPDGAGSPSSTAVTLLDTSTSVAEGAWRHFTVNAPSNKTKLTVTMSGSGDGDLYVRYGSQPTTSAYDFRPYLQGSAESVVISGSSTPAYRSGTQYVSVHGYTAANVTLKVVAE